MNNEMYWFPFKIQNEGCSIVVCGPYKNHE